MSVYGGPDITTDGLILCLDAGNTKSYPGSGTTWYDLSGNNNNASLVNGTIFSNNSFSFDGVNDRATITPIYMYQQSYSVCAFVKRNVLNAVHGIMSDLQYGFWGFYIDNTNKLVMRHYDNINTYSSNMIVSNGSVSSNWVFLVGVFDTTSGMKLYINGVLDNSNSNSTGFQLGSNRGAQHIGQFKNDASNLETNVMNGFISNILFYNKALSSVEVLQNYNALKGRFGL